MPFWLTVFLAVLFMVHWIAFMRLAIIRGQLYYWLLSLLFLLLTSSIYAQTDKPRSVTVRRTFAFAAPLQRMDYCRCDDSNAGFEIEAGKIQKLTALAITWNVLFIRLLNPQRT